LRTIHSRRPRSRVAALPRPKLKRVLDYVTDNLGNNLTLVELAAVSGLSRMHFAAQFRSATGCKPHEYVLNQRIERAKRFLVESDSSLAEIALIVGFQAQSHFTTVFKRVTGETPGYWRQNN
jgi:transcriptional regulator GlxA family with amidase domain